MLQFSMIQCWIVQELSVGNTLSNIGNFKGPMLESCCPILAMHQSNVGHYLTNVRNLSPNVGYCNSNLPIFNNYPAKSRGISPDT